jgi:vitamin B12 transporter
MQFISVCVSLIVLITAGFSADLRIKIIDPQSAVVSGARVELLDRNAGSVVAVSSSSAEGIAQFRVPESGGYGVRVLAAGFAESTSDVFDLNQELTIQLRPATANEVVVVTAARTPVCAEEVNASIAVLTAAQLETLNPIASDDAIRFLPGAVFGTQGQRGGLSSLFVRGGDSRYNKVIVDGVAVNDPGGTFDFGTLPLYQSERLEFLRGAQSTLYGSDAMSSVVQVWSRTGATATPELRFGADGGNFSTAHGYASFAGARSIFDYNFFGDQLNSNGQGNNDDYSDSLVGGNVGIALNDHVALRVRARHSNSRTGVPGEWDFNGVRLFPPDADQFARNNNLLASAELSISGPSRWQHRITGLEFSLRRMNVDNLAEPERAGAFDFPFDAITHINRAGFDYQGDYTERSWARTTFGYEFEDEHGVSGNLPDSLSTGIRRNHAVYGQQFLEIGRLSAVGGVRFVHNESFGNKAVPRIALGFTTLKGGQLFSGTRLRFSYAEGIKEPSFAESFGNGGGFPTEPNPNLKPERARAFEAGIEQKFSIKYALAATYFNNLFRDKIDFNFFGTCGLFCGQYVNVNEALAHGAELEFHGRPLTRLSLDAAYAYTSTQIIKQPFAFDPLLEPGQPLIRRPKHSGTLLLTYIGTRWGGNIGGSFIGRRADSDFLALGFNHAAAYARVDLGAWYAVTSRVTAYANVGNALNRHYEEVVGYPALTANVRAGVRFRIGGD